MASNLARNNSDPLEAWLTFAGDQFDFIIASFNLVLAFNIGSDFLTIENVLGFLGLLGTDY